MADEKEARKPENRYRIVKSDDEKQLVLTNPPFAKPADEIMIPEQRMRGKSDREADRFPQI